MSPSISTNLLSDLDDNFVRVISASKYEGDAHVKVLTEYHDTIKAAVVYDMSNPQYSEPIYERFKTLYEEKGASVVYTNTLNSESIDYEKIAVEIYRSGAQGVVLIANTVDSSNIIQQVARKDKDLIISNSGWSVNYDLIERSGKASEQIYGIAAYITDYDGTDYREFAKEYEERFCEVPFFSAHTTYDAVMALSQAMRQSESLAIDDVKKALLYIGDFNGLQTDFSLNEYGDATRSNMLLRVEDGKFILVEELD
ncbi:MULTISPECIES: ABC transporter substrate-binding protein [unclassified Fusibacter]|uniref:ABC transporter substrate-binding protein n=1 Tax=unclassified Fusibacter TaxID=2624464 RepID=UPI0013E95A6B|nr:ABC transporter substrate-binding protein [Fusibacter sp. A1]NPE22182.1 ABC transporter substrate-binding protein [Fusibacter sp. A1]